MKVIGIDPGSRFTGYGIVEKRGTDLIHVASGRINASKAPEFVDRLEIIHGALVALLLETPCDVGAVESVFVAKNVMSTIKLAQARGVALLAVRQATLPLFEYAPTAVKLAVTGHGRSDKQSVSLMVQRLLNLDAKLSEDASDALAVAICHAHSIDFTDRLQ